MNEDKKSEIQGVELVGVSAVTPHNRALYEAGKNLLVESITTSRDFCKFMISMSTGAIPIYLALIKFVLPDKYTLTFNQSALVVIPAFLFLIASIVFTFGYFPQSGYFSLDIIEEIERERKKTLEMRAKVTWIGFSLFLIGTIISICNIVGILRI